MNKDNIQTILDAKSTLMALASQTNDDVVTLIENLDKVLEESIRLEGKSNSPLRFNYTNNRGESVTTQTDVENNFVLLDVDKGVTIESIQVMPKIAGKVDIGTFKEIAEFVELEINEKYSNYWSNIAFGNASARFLHAYKKYIK